MSSVYPSSSTSSKSSANLLRISGMATGIDTDAVVKSMVSSYQAKIDKANQDKQILEWKQDSYRDVIKGIKELQDYFDPLSSKYILSEKAFNSNSVTNSDSSKVSATVSSSAKAGTYIVNATQLAEQAKIPSSSLNSMVNVTGVTNWSDVSLKVGNKTIDLTSTSVASNATVPTVVASINSQIAAAAATDSSLSGVSASYVSDGTNSYIKFTKSSTNTSTVNLVATKSGSDIVLNASVNSGISSSTKLSDLNISSDVSFDLSYGSTTKQITAKSSDTLQSLMDKVNSATSGAVTMSIDDVTGKISFQSKNYGSTSNITIKNNSSNISNLGITVADPAVGITGTGKDAIVEITAPGQSTTTTTQSSNQFTTNGVTYNITNKGSASVTVTSNTDTVVSNVKKFIDDYNALVSNINTKLTEKKNRDYKPLTDEQKESMSETQIAAWEKKAKSGILRNDEYLNNLLTQLRGTFSPVYSKYTNSTDTTNTKISLNFGNYGTGAIGIDTTKEADGGLIVIKDEAKLKSAIENNLEDFKKLFNGTSSKSLHKDSKGLVDESYVGSPKFNEDGIFKRMDTIIKEYVSSPGLGKDGTYTLSGTMNIFVNKQYDNSATGTASKNTLPDQVYNKALSISKFKTQLSDAQTRYYAKFTALETAMNKLNAQQTQMSSMFGN